MLAELANILLRHDDLARLLRPLSYPEQQLLLQLAMVVMRLGVEAMIAAIRQ